jgi:hypothetical protein
MSEQDDVEWLARKIHATGGKPDRLVVNPANAHRVPLFEFEHEVPADAHNFHIGCEYVFEHGRLLTGPRLAWWRIRQFARHWTRWWRPRTVCSAIDRDAGVVTMVKERWSWRRWRWERVA